VLSDSSVTLDVQRLLDLRHTIKSTNPTPPTGSGVVIGAFRGTRRGQGTDFDDLRRYSHGDDVRHIDWRASARTQQLQTRLYREETEHRVQLLVDLRACMFTGSQQLRAVHACTLAARILWQAVGAGSRLSTIALLDDGIRTDQTRSGTSAAISGCGLLATCFAQAQQQANNQQYAPTDSYRFVGYPQSNIKRTAPQSEQSATLAQALQWQLSQSTVHTNCLWISGLDFPGDHFDDHLKMQAKRGTHVFIKVDDPIEREPLPSGRYPYLTSALKGSARRMASIGFAHRKALQGYLQKNQMQLRERFMQLHIPLLDARHGDQAVVDSLRLAGYLP